MPRSCFALIVLSLSMVALFACPVPAAEYSARVVGVSDGDTITELTANKTQVRVRLYGIDAPEFGQDFGLRAKQAASVLAFGKTVTMRERDKDRYGRTVAEVFLPDGRSMNLEMTAQGMNWWYSQYAPRDRELARAESEAKTAKRGLWSQPGAIPPWNWRKGEGVAVTAAVVENRNSHVDHRPTCRGVAVMKQSNRVEFKSAAEAEKAGDCR